MTVSVLYVAGLGRSGSTLLARLLGEVEGVASVGELHHIWQTGAPVAAADELCGCGRAYADCGFWPELLTAVFDGAAVPLERVRELHDRVSRIRRIPRLERGGGEAFEREVDAYASIWRSIYGEIARRAGRRLVVDASKDLGPLFALSRVPDLELRVLHLIRDPRGVAFSWSRQKRRPEFVGREVYMNRHGPVAVAWRWTYSNLLAERSRGRVAAFRQLRYEELIESPEATLRGICEWAGLERPKLDFVDGVTARLDRSSHLVSGNPMRFDRGSVTLQPDTRWRTEMPKIDRALVSALTWPLRRRYGYRGWS